MHLCTIATVTVHICTVTVTYAFNILLIFFLSYICSHSHFHLTLSSSLLSPHLTPPFSHLLSLSPLPLVKPCLRCRRSNHAFTATDSELHHLFVDFLCRHRDSEILVGTHWSDMTMWWTTWWMSASLINLCSRSRRGSTFGTHWSDEAMNECFVGAKILRYVWWWFGSVRERESCSNFWGRWVWVSVLSDWICERKAVRERIIKNGKRMNILLNKCVE